MVRQELVEDPERAPLVRRAFEEFATGRFTKQQVLTEITRLGLRTRRGLKVSPQAFDAMLENGLYIGIIDVPAIRLVGPRGKSRNERSRHAGEVSHSRRCQPSAETRPAQRHRPLVNLLIDTRAELMELVVTSGLKVLDAMLEEDRTVKGALFVVSR